MELLLENQELRVEITSVGAELLSIHHKDTGRDYMWNGNPAIWGRRSPILFPNCGTAKNGKYIIEGREYPGKQHGFARDMDHSVVCSSGEIATFRLESNSNTLELYPYKFTLKTTYKLEKNTLLCQHKVINCDDKAIYFSFGFHTGISCPFVPGTDSTDYDIVFEKQEDCLLLQANQTGCIMSGQKPYKPDTRKIPITSGVFSKSLILKSPQSKYIQLEERNSGDYLRINGTDSPYTVLWSTPDDVQAVCIEPWYGLGDTVDFDGHFEKKEGINCLAPMQEFVCQQVIEIGMGNK